MSDALRRALRTFVQAFLGSVLTSGLLSAINETGVVDWSAIKKVAVSAAAAALIALLTFVVNALEDKGVMPALIKAPASGGADPIPEDAGT